MLCLKFLRDEVLRELRRSGNGKYLPHNRLMGILEEVRALAVNKATWEEAINSTGGPDSSPNKLHAVSTISNAIKIMLEDYLGPNVGDGQVSPKVDAQVPTREEELVAEIDSLKQRLTDSECRAAEATEQSQRNAARVSELEGKFEAAELVEAKAGQELAKRLGVAQDSAKMMELKLSESDMANNQLRSQVSAAESEIARLRQEIASYESNFSPTTLSADRVPSMHDWRVLQAQLSHLRSSAGGETNAHLSAIESLMSQVQTLEVQKNDADAEITRLRAQIKAEAFVRPESTPSNGGLNLTTPTVRRANTVNIHGFRTPSESGRPSPLAEDFVNVAAELQRSKKKFTSKPERANEQQCVQQ